MVAVKTSWSTRRLAAAGGVLALVAGIGVLGGLALAPRPAAAQAVKTLDAPAGMILNWIDGDQAEVFEEVMTRLRAVMAGSDNPERVAQAAGWKVYRAREPGPNDDVLYVWFIEPTVPNADYSVAQIFNEEVPNEVQQLYERFNDAFGAGQLPLNLDPVLDFSE